jgi:hypothetical protein
VGVFCLLGAPRKFVEFGDQVDLTDLHFLIDNAYIVQWGFPPSHDPEMRTPVLRMNEAEKLISCSADLVTLLFVPSSEGGAACPSSL